MKITLEPSQQKETEVIIRGDVAGAEVTAILQMLGRKNSGKLLLYREEEQYIVDISQIVYLETAGNKVTVFTQEEVYEAKQKLYELMEFLETFSFAQVNKSTIVNIDCVKSIQAEFSGNYRIKFKGRKEVLILSRKYFNEFKNRI